MLFIRRAGVKNWQLQEGIRWGGTHTWAEKNRCHFVEAEGPWLKHKVHEDANYATNNVMPEEVQESLL